MIRFFLPDRRETSVYAMDFRSEFERGVRGVIFDIDNTLVAQDAPVDEKVEALFAELKAAGLSTCLISNNGKGRVMEFAGKLGSHFVPNAQKPSRKAYRKAMEVMGTGINDTLFIGDQLLTDIFGAKRTGIESVLVDPVDPASDLKRIRFKRKIERLILRLGGEKKESEKKDLKKQTQ